MRPCLEHRCDGLLGACHGDPMASDLHVMRPLIYFSFVTISTLGYGDIAPQTPPARALASTEAITGQLFVAVLIAALVGRFIAETPRPPPDRSS